MNLVIKNTTKICTGRDILPCKNKLVSVLCDGDSWAFLSCSLLLIIGWHVYRYVLYMWLTKMGRVSSFSPTSFPVVQNNSSAFKLDRI